MTDGSSHDAKKPTVAIQKKSEFFRDDNSQNNEF